MVLEIRLLCRLGHRGLGLKWSQIWEEVRTGLYNTDTFVKPMFYSSLASLHAGGR